MAKTKRISKVTIRQAQDALSVLFPNCRFTVCPDSRHYRAEPEEIWVHDEHGYGFSFRVSNGPCGIGITIRPFVGGNRVSVTGNLAGDNEVMPQVDTAEVSCTVYRSDERSQAFKAWYRDSENNPYPEKEKEVSA